ncbi:MAG: hypothetical protein IIV55_01575 [Alistipes sp.]|nr:hypothetical protein [Alistipes sp.]
MLKVEERRIREAREVKEIREFREFKEFKGIRIDSLNSLISLNSLNSLISALISPTPLISCQSGANVVLTRESPDGTYMTYFPFGLLIEVPQ